MRTYILSKIVREYLSSLKQQHIERIVNLMIRYPCIKYCIKKPKNFHNKRKASLLWKKVRVYVMEFIEKLKLQKSNNNLNQDLQMQSSTYRPNTSSTNTSISLLNSMAPQLLKYIKHNKNNSRVSPENESRSSKKNLDQNDFNSIVSAYINPNTSVDAETPQLPKKSTVSSIFYYVVNNHGNKSIKNEQVGKLRRGIKDFQSLFVSQQIYLLIQNLILINIIQSQGVDLKKQKQFKFHFTERDNILYQKTLSEVALSNLNRVASLSLLGQKSKNKLENHIREELNLPDNFQYLNQNLDKQINKILQDKDLKTKRKRHLLTELKRIEKKRTISRNEDVSNFSSCIEDYDKNQKMTAIINAEGKLAQLTRRYKQSEITENRNYKKKSTIKNQS